MLVRDLNGRPLFFLEAGDVPRDDSGKPLAERAGNGAREMSLAMRAARLMSDRVVTMDLGPTDVSTPSTVAAYGIPETEFVADTVSPTRLVKHATGVWFAENAGDAVSLVVTSTVPAGAAPAEINLALAPTTFTTTPYALAAKVSRDVSSNADFDLKARILQRLILGLRLLREKRVATLLTTSGNFAAGNRVAAGAKWNLGTTPNPLGDLFAALLTSYLPANTLVLPENAAQYFFQNSTTTVRDYVQAGGPLPRIIVARAKVLSGGSPAYVWGPTLPVSVPLVRIGNGLEDLCTSQTFRWMGEGPDGDGRVDGMLVREFYDKRTGSDWIVVAHNDVEVVISNVIGAVITGALQ